MNRRDILRWIAAAAFSAPAIARNREGHAGHESAGPAPTLPPPPSHTPFPSARRAALERLIDLIIPADETPGAKAAGVVDFVELIHEHWMNDGERQRCDAELSLVLAAFAVGGDAVRLLYDGQRFKAPTLRKLTIYGYYTSEAGASQELDLNLAPGAYDACAKWSVEQRAPSLYIWGIPMNLSTGTGA